MIITTEGELQAWCERVRGAKILCIDTEFASEGRYYAALGTIQVAAGTEIGLIDPLAVRDMRCFFALLSDPAMVKVLHAGEQDLQILYRLMNRPVAPVFDTQVAAAFLGFGDQVSLRKLLQVTLGEAIDKDSTFTDWLRRPLTATQVEYALNDVRYLERLYEVLCQMLSARGRLSFVDEEFRAMASPERLQPVDERQAYLGVKGADRLRPAALGLLQELAAWRELTARRLNMPVRKVVIDPVLVSLAQRPPDSIRQLGQLRGMNPQQANRFGQEILEALVRGRSNTPPRIETVDGFPSALEATVDVLSACMRTLAQEQSISTGILANRSELRELVTGGETASIQLLQGWRRQLAGNALLQALKGGLVVGIDADTKQVQIKQAQPA